MFLPPAPHHNHVNLEHCEGPGISLPELRWVTTSGAGRYLGGYDGYGTSRRELPDHV